MRSHNFFFAAAYFRFLSIYIFTSYKCHSERSEESVFNHFFSAELHFNWLFFKESESNEGLKVGWCSISKNGVLILFRIYIFFSNYNSIALLNNNNQRCFGIQNKGKQNLSSCQPKEMGSIKRKQINLFLSILKFIFAFATI